MVPLLLAKINTKMQIRMTLDCLSHCTCYVIISPKLIMFREHVSVKSNIPTRSKCGPVSTEFQFQDVTDGQLVYPSQYFEIKVTYLQNNTTAS